MQYKSGKIKRYRARRLLIVPLLLGGLALAVITNPASYESVAEDNTISTSSSDLNVSEDFLAVKVLEKLAIKGRAPKTGYNREEFYSGWPEIEGCSLRQRIMKREFGNTAELAENKCTVISGEYDEPYTGEHKIFTAKEQLSKGVQIDHVVALSDAWQKGAQYKSVEERYNLATDPLNLLAVDSKANQGKSDGDAATWLPSNKSFRCQYVARQISVKYKYELWVTQAEHDAMAQVLETCPREPTVGIEK